MAPSPPNDPDARPDPDAAALGTTERAVLAVLLAEAGRVVGRDSILRRAGLRDRMPRRCDAAIVSIRRALGPDAVVTVRGRGWRLDEGSATAAAALLADPA